MVKENWSKEELIVAFNLYCKTPFTKINASNKGVKELAQVIGRSPSAVALKLANYARLDPALQERKISGMKHGSKGEESVWDEFKNNWDELSFESERILANYRGDTIEASSSIFVNDLPIEGKDRESVVKIRVNQMFFRNAVLASYDNRCCITEISVRDLLIAGHIIPWSLDIQNRVNPSNGLCLNALHDRAFDKGLITITPDLKIKLSKELLDGIDEKVNGLYFLPYDGMKIRMPQKFRPSIEFLEYHNKNIFRND